jgi:hypothetical protein
MICRRLVTVALSLMLPSAVLAATGDVRIAGSNVYPESLDADRAGRLYIGSIQGIVYRTKPGGDVAEPWIKPNAANGLLSLLGVLVDEGAGTLWVCSSPMPLRVPPSVGQSALKAFDLHTGALKASYPLLGPKAACNDVAIAPDRTLYVTDTPQGRILTLRRGDKALTLYSEDAGLRGADGIAFAGDGTLYINSVSTNALLRVDRRPDGSFAGATKLTLSQPIAGPDGLRPIGGSRFLQAEGNASKVTIVTITGDRADIQDLATGIPSTAGVAPARGQVYALEGKITYLFDPKLKGQDPGPFHARAVAMPPVAK